MSIQEIDAEITKQLARLKESVNKTELLQVCEFKLCNSHKEIPWDRLRHKGIYLIEIKNSEKFDSFESWIEAFKQEWESEDYLKKFTPNTKKKRIAAHMQNNIQDWIPIYIGKSRNVEKRIYEHIYKELNKTTFALKLMARPHLRDQIFRIKVLEVEVENYDAIVPKIEWQLRNRINPIIGRQ